MTQALQTYEFDEFRVDPVKRRLTRIGGEQIPLTPKVFDTLLYLVRSGGKVIEKDELMREIWADSVVEENNINQNISNLRRVFGEKPGEQRFIVTVAGHGFRFVPDVKTTNGMEVGVVDSSNVEDLDRGSKQESSNQNWLRTLALLGILAVAVFAFYLTRNYSGSVEVPIRTVAVLPFKPLVVEHRNESLELGMADALILKLSGVDELIVRPLSSTRRFSSVDQDSLTAGRELGVESIIDGTIQTWGERVRISAKLIRTSDGKQLWSDQFDAKSGDIIALQDSISEKVAEALKIRLGRHGRKSSTNNIDAYQLYMDGRYLTSKGSPDDLRASILYFQHAIELDPNFALAYTGLAQAYGVLGISGELPVSEAFTQARAAEQRALQLDDGLGEAHVALCMGLFWYDWDWAAAEKECSRAIEIDPNNSDFHGHYAMVLSSTGQHAKALEEARQSRELDPHNLLQSSLEGQFLLNAGRTDEAVARLRRVSELEPNFPLSYSFTSSAYIEEGMFEAAILASRKEFELTGRNEIPFGAYALARSGRRDEARAELGRLLELSKVKNVSPYNIALIYNGLDEHDSSFEWLQKGYKQRDPKMTMLNVERKWHSMRSDSRFTDLLKRMNF